MGTIKQRENDLLSNDSFTLGLDKESMNQAIPMNTPQ